FSPEFEKTNKDLFLHNAAIEVFWVHARNLEEFFTEPPSGGGSVASARDFTDGFDAKLEVDKLIAQTQFDVVHLQYERPTTQDKKLNAFDMQRAYEAIQRAVRKFEAQMTKDANKFWKPRTFMQFNTPANIPSACTAFGSSTSTTA